MNYGFYDENLFIKMDPEEERERYPAQLYHHAATQEKISKKKSLKSVPAEAAEHLMSHDI